MDACRLRNQSIRWKRDVRSAFFQASVYAYECLFMLYISFMNTKFVIFQVNRA